MIFVKSYMCQTWKVPLSCLWAGQRVKSFDCWIFTPKMLFLTNKPLIWLPWCWMSLSFAEKATLCQTDRFPEYTKICNISVWSMPNKPNFRLFLTTCSEFFFLPFSFPFSRTFYSWYLLHCIFFLAAIKSRMFDRLNV